MYGKPLNPPLNLIVNLKLLTLASVAQLVGVSLCKFKVRGSDSQLGHMPRFQVQSPVRVCTRGT